MSVSLALICAALLGVSLAIPSTPSIDPGAYNLTRRIPDDCEPNATCDYFLGINVNSGNSSYIDIYLSGVTTGWVAVGFSPTQDMQNSDVLGCSVETATSIVLPVDTYNIVNGMLNLLDSSGQNQDDIVNSTGEFVNGIITCTFSRLIEGIDPPPQDRNLNESYFLMFGTGPDGRGSPNLASFPQHAVNPSIFPQQVNAVQEQGELVLAGAGNVTAPIREADEYRLRRRDPSGCDPENCDYYMGVDTNVENPDFLDFYLTTSKGQGWVAVGFSDTSNMLDADVVGCNVGNGQVFAVDTYNPGSRTNRMDSTQSDIVLHSGDFQNGTITCVFSRLIVGNNSAPQDFNLNDNFFFLFGFGDTGSGAASFPNHQPGPNPLISGGQFNPAVDSGEIGVSLFRQQLIQAHGILMLVAWPLLAFTAIFFAAWMKPALPNGEWFQVHRAFNIAGMFVAFVAFILVFVAHKDNEPPGLITLGDENQEGTTHYILGIIIMALQIANPIISIFRCKPTGQYRCIFNVIHGIIIGIGVELLAYVNIGIGISIFSERLSDFRDLTLLWVYLAFAIFSTILTVVLFIFFTGEAVIAEPGEKAKLAPGPIKPVFSSSSNNSSKNENVELSQTGGSSEPKAPDGPPARKPPSKDAPLRWIGLGVFLGVMVPIIIALIIMIAVRVES